MFKEFEKAMFDKDKFIESYKLYAEYKFYWRLNADNHKQLGLKIWEMSNGSFYVTQSHFVHTPSQATPYRSSRGLCRTAEEALQTGLDNITAYGPGAIREGHAFDDAWFIPNEDY